MPLISQGNATLIALAIVLVVAAYWLFARPSVEYMCKTVPAYKKPKGWKDTGMWLVSGKACPPGFSPDLYNRNCKSMGCNAKRPASPVADMCWLTGGC